MFSLVLLVLCISHSGLLLTNAQHPACTIQNCYCSQSSSSVHPDVTCFVQAISSYDETVRTLPSDLVSLTLTCSDSKRPSLQSGGILSRFSLLQFLTIEDCQIDLLDKESLSGLSNLSNLTITNSAITHVENNVFLPFSQLKALKIVNAGIAYLPDISNLTELLYLNVSNNGIRHINLSEFTSVEDHESSLLNLREIDLSYNQLGSMPLTLLRRSPHLEHLLLMNNGITDLEIPEDLELKNLTILDARQNLLETVDFPRLAQARGLVELRLEGSGQPLQHDGLTHLKHLTEISLINFAITDAVWDELNSTALARLDLTNNELSSIDITQLPALRTLRLAMNNISSVANTTFVNQPGLLLINVSRNNISALPAGVFQNNTNLRALDVSSNKIAALRSDVFKGLYSLFYVDFSYNLLPTLPYLVFKDQASMFFLYLQGNKLTFLPKLSYMPALNLLNISQNSLKSLTSYHLSQLTELQFLYANDNNLTMLEPGLFSSTPGLLEVWLQNNQISTVGSLGPHAKLHSLRLDDNRLTDFYTVSPFAQLSNLKYLFLDGNAFERIKLHTFPPSIEMLLLDRNRLTTLFSTSFQDLPNLKMVSMTSNNMIMSLPLVSVNNFGDHHPKPNFHIGFNVFLCDCNMAYLKVIAEDGYSQPAFNKFYPKFSGLEYSMCITLFNRQSYTPFNEVPLSDFVCSYRETWCDLWCDCCSQNDSCDCAFTCPAGCECYYGGSGFKKYYYHINCDFRNFTQVPSQIPSRAVIVRLDGNDFQHLPFSSLSHLRDTEILQLNGSKVTDIDTGTFDDITALEILRLEDNLLETVPENLFGNLTSLKELYLHNNQIKYISPQAFSRLLSVETITLHNNKLILLDDILQVPTSLFSLTLSENPWACNCDVARVILRAIQTTAIDDKKRMCCFVYGDISLNGSKIDMFNESLVLSVRSRLEETKLNVENISFISFREDVMPDGNLSYLQNYPERECFPLLNYDYDEMCIFPVGNSTYLWAPRSAGISAGVIALIAIVVLLLLTACLVVVIMVKHREFQAWAFVKLGVRIFDEKKQLDKEDAQSKAFDAFISYSSKDDLFVTKTLVPALEAEGRRYRVCVHYRDFPVGQIITDTIYRAIENSSRTILLLSQNFLESEWCRFEFQTAHHHILREGSHRLIIVVLGDLPENLVDPDLKVHLKSNTYLKYEDPWFWEKLYFALPDIRDREARGDDGPMDVARAMGILSGAEEENGNTIEQVHGDNNKADPEIAKEKFGFENEVNEIYGHGREFKNNNIEFHLNKASDGIEDKGTLPFNQVERDIKENGGFVDNQPNVADKEDGRKEGHADWIHRLLNGAKHEGSHWGKAEDVVGYGEEEINQAENGSTKERTTNVHSLKNSSPIHRDGHDISVKADVHIQDGFEDKTIGVMSINKELEDNGGKLVNKNNEANGVPDMFTSLDTDGDGCATENFCGEDEDETCAYYVADYDMDLANDANRIARANFGDTDSGLASDGGEEREADFEGDVVENVPKYSEINQSLRKRPSAEHDLYLSIENNDLSCPRDSRNPQSIEKEEYVSCETDRFASVENGALPAIGSDSPTSIDSSGVASIDSRGLASIESGALASIDSNNPTSIENSGIANIKSGGPAQIDSNSLIGLDSSRLVSTESKGSASIESNGQASIEGGVLSSIDSGGQASTQSISLGNIESGDLTGTESTV